MKVARYAHFPYSFLSFPLLGALCACSSARVRVMPGENGVNQVVSRDLERDGAEEASVKAANKYCEKQGRQAIFVKNAVNYTGTMDEETRKTVRKASRAASVLGSMGSPIQQAGLAGTMMTGDRDYESQVLFKCQ